MLVLNKIDLATPGELDEAKAVVREINPDAVLLFAEQGDTDLALLLDGPESELLAQMKAEAEGRPHHHDGHGSEHGHEHHDHHHGHAHSHAPAGCQAACPAPVGAPPRDARRQPNPCEQGPGSRPPAPASEGDSPACSRNGPRAARSRSDEVKKPRRRIRFVTRTAL